MTLGEKIKTARIQAGLTQEQLAEKLLVSRPAIAKWEADKGIPDIENLKALSKLLNVSIDYLVDEENTNVSMNVIRETLDLSEYGKGKGKKVKDSVMRVKFPNAKITNLLAEKKLTKGEKVIDNMIGFLTDAPFGIPQMINATKMLDREFYLVEKDNALYLVTVGNDFIETMRLATGGNDENDKGVAVEIKKDKFQIGDIVFTVCKHGVE